MSDNGEFQPISVAFQSLTANFGLISTLIEKLGEDAARNFCLQSQINEDIFDAVLARMDTPKAGAKIVSLTEAKKKKEETLKKDNGEFSKKAKKKEDNSDTPELLWRRTKDPVKPLSDDCPVAPVGISKSGKNFYYLNPLKQLVEMQKGDFGAEGLRKLFGNADWLWGNFPKFNASTFEQTGWKADQASETLIAAAYAKKQFEPLENQRGLGGWKNDNGDLIFHCGDVIYKNNQVFDPGFIDGYLYASERKGLYPAESQRTREKKKEQSLLIDDLLKLFDKWNWGNDFLASDDKDKKKYEDVDGSGHKLSSLLLLGWIAAAKAGGALDYRPLLWVSGSYGNGKSTLQTALKYIFGGDLVKASDPTPAGIWQVLGVSTRPVMIDEAEPDHESKKIQGIINLARQSATPDGVVLRGSSGHQATAFIAQSAFLFSSILIPPMLSQDVSRFTFLDLDTLTKGAKVDIVPHKLKLTGSIIKRKLIDNWDRWKQTLDLYRSALSENGHDHRRCDQLGTLLAMSDMMRFEECADNDTISMLVDIFKPDKEKKDSYRSMLDFLLSIQLEVFRGGNRETIAALIARAAGIIEKDPDAAKSALEQHGIFVINEGEKKFSVALPNQHTSLARLFERSQWYAKPGTAGGWSQAIRKIKDKKGIECALEWKSKKSYSGRGWKIPLKVFLDIEDE